MLAYASASHAAEPLTAGFTRAVPEGSVKKADASPFDLASLGAGLHILPAPAGVEQRMQPKAGTPRDFVPGKTDRYFRGPAVNYHAGDRGPVIELGLLGGTVMPIQRLAHLALDWDF
jgi:hypothetical protein